MSTTPRPRRKRRQFMVGGQTWRVLLVPPTDPRIIDEDGKPMEGVTIHNDCLLLINETFVGDAREEIFIHEVDHIINRVSGARHEMTLHLRSEKSRDKHEERIVRARTPATHQLWKALGFKIPKGLLT